MKSEEIITESAAEVIDRGYVRPSWADFISIADGWVSLSIYPHPNNTYDIELSRIKTPGDVCKWVYHLSQKDITTHADYTDGELLSAFIYGVYKAKGWEIHGL